MCAYVHACVREYVCVSEVEGLVHALSDEDRVALRGHLASVSYASSVCLSVCL